MDKRFIVIILLVFIAVLLLSFLTANLYQKNYSDKITKKRSNYFLYR